MATAKKNPNISVVPPINSEASEEALRLIAERDALTKRIRELTKKSPARKVLSLVEVEARQTEHLAIYLVDTFTSFAKARVQAGAEPKYAVQSVLAMYQSPVLQALNTHLETGEPIADVTARMLGRVRSHRQPKEE